jgi:hypothetical protein
MAHGLDHSFSEDQRGIKQSRVRLIAKMLKPSRRASDMWYAFV